MAETRPWMGSYVSLAQFKMTRSLQIMDCSKRELFFPTILFGPSDDEFDFPPINAQEKEDAVWGEIGYALSEPTTRSDSMAEYAPTQILAEAVRKNGFDGIRYKSLLGDGHNFALFDVNSADLINCCLCKTTKISFQFEQVANTYFVAKHYPDISKQ